MKILISGAGGYLGVRLAECLVERGHSVIAMVRSEPKHNYLQRDGIEVAKGDILDAPRLRELMEGVDAVFHCAGVISYDPAKDELMYQTNVVGTRTMAEAALASGVKRFVYTSSTAALGVNYDPKKRVTEEDPFNARALGMSYFTSKYDAEQELHKLREKGLDYVILNPASIIGPRDTRRYEQVYAGLIYKFNPRILPPGGNAFVDLEDVVEGHIRAWEKGKCGERYILSGENLSFAELIIRVNKLIGRKPPSARLPLFCMSMVAASFRVLAIFGQKLHMTPELISKVGRWYLYVDTSKAEQELGMKFRTIDHALQETLDWLKAEGRIQ